jgi:hypothetical protein
LVIDRAGVTGGNLRLHLGAIKIQVWHKGQEGPPK